MKDYNLINRRATTCKHGGHCEWVACDKCNHYEPDVLNQQPCEDCRNCKEWNRCPCGKEGHENGTSIGYSIGECKNYEPCDDCISRVEAIEEADKLCLETGYDNEKVIEMLNNLSPVTPKEKTGHWIRQTDEHHDYYYECEYCGITVGLDDIKNFCPNCGAKMVSEDKNDRQRN